VGFFYNSFIGGRGHGDMVFIWGSPVCIVAFEPYLQQVFWEELKNQIV
jgi:hypothetical protein